MNFEIVIDAESPYALAHFWAEALQGYRVRPYDDDEIARLASLGLVPESDTSVAIDAAQGPTLWFQQSDDSTHTRNRIHLDLKFAERNVEIDRLERLGATVREVCDDHVVMLDPEGNQFCLFDP